MRENIRINLSFYFYFVKGQFFCDTKQKEFSDFCSVVVEYVQ